MSLTVLAFLITIICILDKLILKLSSKNITIKREIQNNNRCYKGETFNIKTIFENRKRMPISLAYVNESYIRGIKYIGKFSDGTSFSTSENVSKYALNSYERRSKLITMKAEDRGVYTINAIDVRIGDFLGLYNVDFHINDYLIVIVYPELRELSEFRFESRCSFGDIPIKNWLYKDTFLIKGIRDYTFNDRMKDVHWKATARMNKLMVKEYDCTTDTSLMIYINIGNRYVYDPNKDGLAIEKGIEIAASIIKQCINEGISVGIGTNSYVIKNDNIKSGEILPLQGNLDLLLEYCASIYNSVSENFTDYLIRKFNRFRTDMTYMFICRSIDDEDIILLKQLISRGIIIYMLDISENTNLPLIDGITKINYKGEKCDEYS